MDNARILVSKAVESLRHAPDEALVLRLALAASHVEAAATLTGWLATADPSSLVARLAELHAASSEFHALTLVAEFASEFGFRSRDEVFSQISRAAPAQAWVRAGRAICASNQAPDLPVPRNDQMTRSLFRRLTEQSIAPIADKIHRHDLLVPEELINQLGELGCFGFTVPEAYGGYQFANQHGPLGMVVVSEELSRGSLGAGGSLVAHSEILARMLLKGGTDEQKEYFLPRIASGDRMVALAVTEIEHGSDIGNLQTSAQPVPGGWVMQGSKSWCTFAGRADLVAVLCRTDPDPSLGQQGLSLFLIEKPTVTGHSFRFEQNGRYLHDGTPHLHPRARGWMIGSAIPTPGFRGMHSFEVRFEQWFVPSEALVGGHQGLGRGFELHHESLSLSRLQVAASANGLMRAALERAVAHANRRLISGRPVSTYPAATEKIARMAASLLGSQALTYRAAPLLGSHAGPRLAATAKLYAARTAEWLTREAQQLHGGQGYIEDNAVARYFVDARALSISEGVEETLASDILAAGLPATERAA